MFPNAPISVCDLRANRWHDLPSEPGVYWWYFSQPNLDRFRITDFCQIGRLHLRRSSDDKLCLYCGMTKNLAQRVQWHAEQTLSLDVLRNGFLSTFRFTLLALNEFDYLAGSYEIDRFMDGLSLAWMQTDSCDEAEAIESGELNGEFQYPLNIQNNKCLDLKSYLNFLKSTRKAYKQRYVGMGNQSSQETQPKTRKKLSTRDRLDESY